MTSALRWGWVVSTTPLPLYPRERPGTHCTGCWVGPRAGLDGCVKSRPPLGFDPRTVQPVASRYTDWAIAATSGNVWWVNYSSARNQNQSDRLPWNKSRGIVKRTGLKTKALVLAGHCSKPLIQKLSFALAINFLPPFVNRVLLISLSWRTFIFSALFLRVQLV